MNESMYNFMRVGLIPVMAYPSIQKGIGYVEEIIKRIAADEYFNAIEVTWIKDTEVRKRVKKILDTSHMTVAYGGHSRLTSAGLNINDINEEKRQMAISVLKEGIDEAYELGAVGFAYLSGRYEDDTKEESFRALVKSTKELCAYAGSKGDIKVIHEVFDYDIDKKSLIGPVVLAKRYAEEVCKEYDNFGLMVDLSHLPLLRESAEESLIPIKDYIAHAHMGNAVVKEGCEAYGDQHPRFGFPNSANDVDELIEYLRVLLDIGFLNKKKPPIVSFEVKPWDGEDSDIVVANAKRTLNEAWARL